MDYWPWWAGAIGLAGISITNWLILGRPLGVSGLYVRLMAWKTEHELEEIEAEIAQSPEEYQHAMLEATLEEFCDDLTDEEREELKASMDATPAGDEAQNTSQDENAKESTEQTDAAKRPPIPPLTAVPIFLGALVFGGFLSKMVEAGGMYFFEYELTKTYHEFMGTGLAAWGILMLGGIFVGFGTAMAGGCTSGHGLGGCARAQPGSLVATASFFGTAIGISFLFKAVLQ